MVLWFMLGCWKLSVRGEFVFVLFWVVKYGLILQVDL